MLSIIVAVSGSIRLWFIIVDIVLMVKERNNVYPSHRDFNAGHLALWRGCPKHVIRDVVRLAHHVSPWAERMSAMEWVKVSLAIG